MIFKAIKENESYTIREDGVIFKNDLIVKPFKDGYVTIGDRRRLPIKVLYENFPEQIPGKQIPGFPLYNITEDGQVFSMRNCRFSSLIKQKRNKSEKYDMTVKLYKSDGSKKAYGVLVHRLVAEAFIPNPDNKPEVNHKDGNPSNNNVDNLEWMTHVENAEHAAKNYLYTGQQKKVLMRRQVSDEPIEYRSMQEAADKLGMKARNANKNISECCSKNASDRTNRGKCNKLYPFRTENYIFTYA